MRFGLVLFLITGLCFEARAFDVPENCPEKPIEKEASVALARTWFGKGQESVLEKEYSKAMNAFLCSLTMVEHPSTIFNAGNAAFLAQRYDVANEMAQKILSRDDVDEKTREDAEKLLADSQNAMEESEASQEESVSASPFLTETEVDSKKNNNPSAENGMTQTEAPAVKIYSLQFWGWTSLGVSGALLIGGGITGSVALAKNVEAKDACQGGVCYEADYHLLDTRNNLATASTVLFLSAGAIAATSAVLLIVGAKKESKKPSVAWALGPNGVHVQGAF